MSLRRKYPFATAKTAAPEGEFPANVIIYCPILRNNITDQPLLQSAAALECSGHKVTLLTSNVKVRRNNDEEINLPIKQFGRLIPQNIFGYFAGFFYFWRTFILASWCLFCKPFHNPGVILYNEPSLSLRILKRFTNFRFIQFQTDKKQTLPATYLADLLKTVDLSCADEILLPSEVAVEHAAKGTGICHVKMQTLYPAVDTGVFRRTVVMARSEILPMVPENSYYFLTYGEFKRESNFRLALQSFEILRQHLGINSRMKLHFVLAGPDDGLYEPDSYSNLIAKTSNMHYRHNLVFRKNLNTIQRKSLIYHSVAVLLLNTDTVYDRLYFETMALGKPIISMESNSFAREIIENKCTGYLIPTDPRYIANVMKLLLQKRPYAKVVGELAANQFNTKYSYTAFARNLDAFLKCSNIDDSTSSKSTISVHSQATADDVDSDAFDDDDIIRSISRTSIVSVVTDKAPSSITDNTDVESEKSFAKEQEADESIEEIIREPEKPRDTDVESEKSFAKEQEADESIEEIIREPEKPQGQIKISSIRVEGLQQRNIEAIRSGARIDAKATVEREYRGIAYLDDQHQMHFEPMSQHDLKAIRDSNLDEDVREIALPDDSITNFESCLYPHGPRPIIQRYQYILKQRNYTVKVRPNTEMLDYLTEEDEFSILPQH